MSERHWSEQPQTNLAKGTDMTIAEAIKAGLELLARMKALNLIR